MTTQTVTLTHTGLFGTVYTLVFSESTQRWTWRNEQGHRASAHYKSAESAQVFTRLDHF